MNEYIDIGHNIDRIIIILYRMCNACNNLFHNVADFIEFHLKSNSTNE